MIRRRITAGKMLEFASDMAEVFSNEKESLILCCINLCRLSKIIFRQWLSKWQINYSGGWVEKKVTPEGIVVKITDKGRVQTLKFKLKEMRRPGLVGQEVENGVFDIAELERGKRIGCGFICVS